MLLGGIYGVIPMSYSSGTEHPEHHATSHLNMEVEHGAVFGFICIVSR